MRAAPHVSHLWIKQCLNFPKSMWRLILNAPEVDNSRNRLEAATKRRAASWPQREATSLAETKTRYVKKDGERNERTRSKRKHTHEKCEISFPSERILLKQPPRAGAARCAEKKRKSAYFRGWWHGKLSRLQWSQLYNARNDVAECSCWLWLRMKRRWLIPGRVLATAAADQRWRFSLLLNPDSCDDRKPHDKTH